MANTLTSPNNIFALEQDVLTKLNTFNSIYANYLNCTLARSTISTGCPSTAVTIENVSATYNDTRAAILKLNAALQSVNTGTPSAKYDATYQNIMSQYEKLIKNRAEIDVKLKELYSTDGSSSNFYDRQYISTAYTKILWTVLATTIAYYVFLKIHKS